MRRAAGCSGTRRTVDAHFDRGHLEDDGWRSFSHSDGDLGRGPAVLHFAGDVRRERFQEVMACRRADLHDELTHGAVVHGVGERVARSRLVERELEDEVAGETLVPEALLLGGTV